MSTPFHQLPIDQVRRLGNQVQVGRYSYFHGQVHLVTWVPGEKITIGNFCSIANDVMICVGGNHRTDRVSTFPFDAALSGTACAIEKARKRHILDLVSGLMVKRDMP